MKRITFVSLAILNLSLLAAGCQAVAQDTSQKGSPTSSATPPAGVPEGVDPNAKPSPAPAEPPVSPSRAFTNLTCSKDYDAGTMDANGQFMTGTETMRLLQHQGRLFAGLDAWMDTPYNGPRPEGKPPWTGPQVLVKESAAAPWRVDIAFPYAVRMEGMTSATFVTDGSGRKLDPPVRLLVASPSYRNTAACWTRDDGTGKWTRLVIAERLRGGGVRSFCTHVDKVTGIQCLFGGTTFHDGLSGSIFRAIYDPAAPGKLRWDKDPELSGTGRVMCFAEADGVLYAAGGIKDETPLSGGLFRRVDGNTPRWELLWRWPHLIQEHGDETVILRGLTAIPDPNGGQHQVLLGTCHYPGVVYRIDPSRGCAVTTELDIRAYFAKAFGVAKLAGPCLSAYNNFLPATDPDTGEKILLLGVWVNHPDGKATEKGASAWYLVRHADGTYSHGRGFDPKNPRPNPPRGLLATRTIELSPFPEDKGRVYYFGGYDCADIESHSTAWIYKGERPPPKAKE
jgi:hypothetical protein